MHSLTHELSSSYRCTRTLGAVKAGAEARRQAAALLRRSIETFSGGEGGTAGGAGDDARARSRLCT